MDCGLRCNDDGGFRKKVNIFNQILKIVKLTPTYLIAIILSLIVILFTPDKLLIVPGLIEFRDDYNQFLSPFLILSSFLIIVLFISTKWKRHKRLTLLKRYLHTLTNQEKSILMRYIYGETRTLELREQDGNVIALAQNRVIIMGPIVMQRTGYRVCNIQNWAWIYLNKNKQLIDVTKKVEI